MIDAHIHLFDHAGLLENIPERCIGFCDIPLYKGPDLDGICEDAYDKYLPYLVQRYPCAKFLCTAPTFSELTRIWAKHRYLLSGFGELKMYDIYKDKAAPYKDSVFLEQVLNFSAQNGNKPVYVHWTIRTPLDYRTLRSLANKYPRVPLVLCHCGLDQYLTEPLNSFRLALRLAIECPSIWLDLSWHGLIWLNKNPAQFSELPRTKILLGSDFSSHMDRTRDPIYTREDINNLINKYKGFCNWDNNVCRLFSGDGEHL